MARYLNYLRLIYVIGEPHIVFFAEYLPIVILVESVVTTGDIVFVWYDLVFCAANGMFGHKNSLFS